MKKCPNCGRMYSDFVTTCSACNADLSGNQKSNSGNYSSNSNNQSRPASNQNAVQQYNNSNTNAQNGSAQNGNAQTNKPKKSWLSYLAGLAAFVVAYVLFSSENIGFFLGAALVGLGCGCIPYFIGQYRGNQKMGTIGLAVTAIIGFLFGIVAAAVSAVIFTVIILVMK